MIDKTKRYALKLDESILPHGISPGAQYAVRFIGEEGGFVECKTALPTCRPRWQSTNTVIGDDIIEELFESGLLVEVT